METKIESHQSKSVFHLSTPEQLFLKFYWELGNLRDALNGQAHKMRSYEVAAYHAYNAAVTAWHLSDWTWKFLSPEAQTRVALGLGFETSKNPMENLKNFQQAIRRKSRAIEICWDIANGSKHLDTHKYSKVDAQMKVEVKSATASEFRAGQPLQTINYDFIVHWDNKTLRIIEVFEEARDFWMQFLHSLGLIGDMVAEFEFTVTVTRGDTK